MGRPGTIGVVLVAGVAVLAAAWLYFNRSGKHGEDAAVREIENGRDGEWVILLHGIFRSPRSMAKIETALAKRGYRVINFGYPSTRESIEDIAELLHQTVQQLPPERGRLHFVTHSLGGIVVRYYLAHYACPNPGRVVMIAPPNRGSTLASYLGKWMPYRWAFGRAGQQVAGAPDSYPLLLPPPRAEFGVIAGGLGSEVGINPFIPGDNDGTVKVEETKLPGMKDFILLKGQHSTLLAQRAVADNVLFFLSEGKFLHEK
ncbi:MAG TPA: alpha/beta fold hydrolase [Spirochaetota bacterium]|nr:alpha/beta fold hydrolase [Spirochaetota bacterium]